MGGEVDGSMGQQNVKTKLAHVREQSESTYGANLVAAGHLETALTTVHTHSRVSPSLAARYLEKKTRRFFDYFRAPPFLFPRVNPRLTRRWIKTGAPDKKNSVD